MSTKTMAKSAQQGKKDGSKKAPKENLNGSADLVEAGSKSEKTDADEGSDEIHSDEIIETEGVVDPDELEEQEDEAAASNGGSNAAALAAASGSSEMSASFKNFRHHPDMENFYRFIYENDLRHEALAIIDEIMVEKIQRKMVKGSKSQPH